MTPLELAGYVAAVVGVVIGLGLAAIFVAVCLLFLFDWWDKRTRGK